MKVTGEMQTNWECDIKSGRSQNTPAHFCPRDTRAASPLDAQLSPLTPKQGSRMRLQETGRGNLGLSKR